MTRLKNSLLKDMSSMSKSDKELLNEIQGHLCGALQVMVHRLPDETIVKQAQGLMSLFLAVLKSQNQSSVHEEALMGISAMANSMFWMLLGLFFLSFLFSFFAVCEVLFPFLFFLSILRTR
jgi:hypothetical protein